MIMWTGCSVAIYTSFLVTLMSKTMDDSWPDDKKSKFSLLAMIGLGIGEIIGSLISGQVLDRFGYKKMSFFIMMTMATAGVIVILYTL